MQLAIESTSDSVVEVRKRCLATDREFGVNDPIVFQRRAQNVSGRCG
jgi:hypothetical protein